MRKWDAGEEAVKEPGEGNEVIAWWKCQKRQKVTGGAQAITKLSQIFGILNSVGLLYSMRSYKK